VSPIDDAPATPAAPAAPAGLADELDERLRAANAAELTPAQAEARRLGDAMRKVIDRLVVTSAPPEELAKAADELEKIAAALEPYPQGRMYDGFAESANAGDPRAFFDWSPLLGRANPLAPPISVEMDDGNVIGWARFGSAYEGPPGCVHGGFIAASFDDVLGLTQSLSGQPGMTGTLTVRYRKPTPLYTELRFVGKLLGIDGRKILTHGELWAGELLTAEADGLFISVGVVNFNRLREEREKRLRSGREG
jgi:acyl-coenzyme A thioesterase PaaI-like protein